MGIRKDEKLNRLLRMAPEGVAIPSPWLTAQGYSRQLIRKYVQSGWLVALGSRGVYAHPGSPVEGEGVLLGLQHLGGFDLYSGGVSALERQGYAHYLSLGGNARMDIWGRDKPPQWLSELDLSPPWSFHRRQLFLTDPEGGWVDLPTKIRDWTLRVSAPERALLEVLSEVDETPASFIHVAELFEGLSTARPSVVTALLRACKHCKAKRLFLFFGAHYQHGWFKKVDDAGIDLGKGKRVITRGGKFDKRFQITVPEAFHAG